MISSPQTRNYAPKRNYPTRNPASIIFARLFCYTIFGACVFVVGHWAGETRAITECKQVVR
ncbi:MAG: hypothetical protein MUP61_07480 [Burkholderiales bacterium]|nr:hypothetical protein [Burkholderiales bacterium]